MSPWEHCNKMAEYFNYSSWSLPDASTFLDLSTTEKNEAEQIAGDVSLQMSDLDCTIDHALSKDENKSPQTFEKKVQNTTFTVSKKSPAPYSNSSLASSYANTHTNENDNNSILTNEELSFISQVDNEEEDSTPQVFQDTSIESPASNIKQSKPEETFNTKIQEEYETEDSTPEVFQYTNTEYVLSKFKIPKPVKKRNQNVELNTIKRQLLEAVSIPQVNQNTTIENPILKIKKSKPGNILEQKKEHQMIERKVNPKTNKRRREPTVDSEPESGSDDDEEFSNPEVLEDTSIEESISKFKKSKPEKKTEPKVPRSATKRRMQEVVEARASAPQGKNIESPTSTVKKSKPKEERTKRKVQHDDDEEEDSQPEVSKDTIIENPISKVKKLKQQEERNPKMKLQTPKRKLGLKTAGKRLEVIEISETDEDEEFSTTEVLEESIDDSTRKIKKPKPKVERPTTKRKVESKPTGGKKTSVIDLCQSDAETPCRPKQKIAGTSTIKRVYNTRQRSGGDSTDKDEVGNKPDSPPEKVSKGATKRNTRAQDKIKLVSIETPNTQIKKRTRAKKGPSSPEFLGEEENVTYSQSKKTSPKTRGRKPKAVKNSAENDDPALQNLVPSQSNLTSKPKRGKSVAVERRAPKVRKSTLTLPKVLVSPLTSNQSTPATRKTKIQSQVYEPEVKNTKRSTKNERGKKVPERSNKNLRTQ